VKKKQIACSLALIILVLALLSCTTSPLPDSYNLETPRPHEYDLVQEYKEFFDYTFGEGNYSYTRESTLPTDRSYFMYNYYIVAMNEMGEELTMRIFDDPGTQASYVLCNALNGRVNSMAIAEEKQELDFSKYFTEEQIEMYDLRFTSRFKRVKTELTYTDDDPIISTTSGIKLSEVVTIEDAMTTYGYQYFAEITSKKDIDPRELERGIKPIAKEILDYICEYLNVEDGYAEFTAIRKEGGILRRDVIYKKGRVKNAQVIIEITLSPPRV
jgi:hypothetical protein